MRLNTSTSGKVLRFIYLLCILSLFFDLLMLRMDGSWGSFVKLSPYAAVVILFLIYRGLPQFIYDSDGEVLNFTSREPNFKFLEKEYLAKHIEFPKRKLLDFKINIWPFRRRLTIYIKSKDGTPKRHKVSISYLKAKEVRDLRRSLNRVLVNNRQSS